MVRIGLVFYFMVVQLVFIPSLRLFAMDFIGNDELQLHKAVADNKLSQVQKLFRNGADIESESPDGRTPLFIAVQKGHVDIIRFLLAHGANPNAQVSEQYFYISPFMYALTNKTASIVALFFEETVTRKPAQEYMSQMPDKFFRTMTKKYMIKRYEKDKSPEYDYSLQLAMCAEIDALKKVKIMVESGFNLNVYFSCNCGSYNPLEYAYHQGYSDMAEYFEPLYTKILQVKKEKRAQRLSSLKLLAPSTKLLDRYKPVNTVLPNLVVTQVPEQKVAESGSGYCLVQ